MISQTPIPPPFPKYHVNGRLCQGYIMHGTTDYSITDTIPVVFLLYITETVDCKYMLGCAIIYTATFTNTLHSSRIP